MYGTDTFNGLLYIIAYVLSVVAFYKLFKRTGHSGLWWVLALIPGLHFLLFLYLAFKKWPVETATTTR